MGVGEIAFEEKKLKKILEELLALEGDEDDGDEDIKKLSELEFSPEKEKEKEKKKGGKEEKGGKKGKKSAVEEEEEFSENADNVIDDFEDSEEEMKLTEEDKKILAKSSKGKGKGQEVAANKGGKKGKKAESDPMDIDEELGMVDDDEVPLRF